MFATRGLLAVLLGAKDAATNRDVHPVDPESRARGLPVQGHLHEELPTQDPIDLFFHILMCVCVRVSMGPLVSNL